mgnify:CR=1 FL=1
MTWESILKEDNEKASAIKYLTKVDKLITELEEAYEDFKFEERMFFFSTDPRADMDLLVDKLIQQKKDIVEMYELEEEEV